MKPLFSLKSIYIRFVIIFVGILWISSTLAFMLGFSFFKENIIDSIQKGLYAKAAHIMEFTGKYEVQPEDLQELLNDDAVKITVFYDIDALALLTEQEKEAARSGQMVTTTMNKKFNLPVVVLKMQDAYILLSTSPNRDIIAFFRNLIGMVLLICALFGSGLIAVASRMIVKPIKRLTRATQEVAKGNFDIKLPIKSHDELGILSSNFNIMTEELKNIEYLRKDFISSVSHEFKTPMTSIQGFAKLLKDPDLTVEQANEYTDIIIAETNRLSHLSTNLLRLSKLENQSIQEQYSSFSLDEQIRNVILLLEPKWAEKELALDLELDEAMYHGDEELMKQVWINLIENAVKFSNSQSSLGISLHRDQDKIRVAITDYGIGIAQEDQERIFEKFYKADKARSKDGSGLGLSIAKKIIELHQGRIYCQSELGTGTTFVVELYP